MLFVKRGLCWLCVFAETMLDKQKYSILQNLQKYFSKTLKKIRKKVRLKEIPKIYGSLQEEIPPYLLGSRNPT